jgi:glycosyltransferase involved in cell wall biosynthesis
MKILLIHNQYKQAGGEDAVFRAESDLFCKHGHHVEMLVYDNSSIKSIVDTCISGLKTIYNPDSARALNAKILEFHPDVIHVHNFLPLVSPSVFFMAKKWNVPILLTLHNYRLICPSATLFFKGRIYEKSLKSIFPMHAIWLGIYRNSQLQTAMVVLMTAVHHLLGTWRNKIDGYITLTQFAKEKFASSALSIPEHKLFVKPNFVEDCDPEVFEREDFFLFVGRLTEEKGIETLLKAADLYYFKVVIIGDGPLRSRVEDCAKKNPNITYIGFQPKKVILDYLKKCKALIFPSLWYEGFPVTLAEAFSTATPVIASDLGSMKEIIQDHVNGLLFKAGNVDDLIFAIMDMAIDDQLAKKLSVNARASYTLHYTPEKNYTQLLGIYRQAMARKVVDAEPVHYPVSVS